MSKFVELKNLSDLHSMRTNKHKNEDVKISFIITLKISVTNPESGFLTPKREFYPNLKFFFAQVPLKIHSNTTPTRKNS